MTGARYLQQQFHSLLILRSTATQASVMPYSSRPSDYIVLVLFADLVGTLDGVGAGAAGVLGSMAVMIVAVMIVLEEM